MLGIFWIFGVLGMSGVIVTAAGGPALPAIDCLEAHLPNLGN